MAAAGWRALRGTTLTFLPSLIARPQFRENDTLGSEGVAAISAPLVHLSRLRHLDLKQASMSLDAQGVAALSRTLGTLTALESLNLGYNNM